MVHNFLTMPFVPLSDYRNKCEFSHRYQIHPNGTVWDTKRNRSLVHTKTKEGYNYVQPFDNRTGKTRHRYVARLLVYHFGDINETQFANQDVDHCNRKRDDNRLLNLKAMTRSDNNCNREKWSGCSSSLKGVSWSKQTNKWQSSIRIHKKLYHLGYFIAELEAGYAYDLVARARKQPYTNLNMVGREDELHPVRKEKIKSVVNDRLRHYGSDLEL